MKKSLAVGIDNYRKLIESGAYYVDKTLLIQEFLDLISEVTLITRPRRFGKTLNMTMIRDFFDITQDSKEIFKGTKIMQTDCAKFINSRPVIYMTFKGCNGKDEKELIRNLKDIIYYEYLRYKPVLESKKQKVNEDIYRKFIEYFKILGNDEKYDYDDIRLILSKTLMLLTRVIYECYDIEPIVIIDEYDNPFIEAKANGYYKEVRGILSDLFGNTFKGNDYLDRGIMTGIQRIAQESIFSKFNNPTVCTVADDDYSDKFGLTEEETKEYLEYFGYELNDKVKKYYDGYKIGENEVYNPMSITSYIRKKGKLESYWVNTSANTLIKEEIPKGEKSFHDNFEKLIEKRLHTVNIDLKTTFAEKQTPAGLWGLLLNAGYITVEKKVKEGRYTIRIPNEEVKSEFQKIVANYIKVDDNTLDELFEALMNKDMDEFISIYEQIIRVCSSYFDAADKENSYHMMMLGMTIYLEPRFRVESNRERGKGRSDISIYAKQEGDLNVIIEFKYENKENTLTLEEEAKDALQQIKDNKYYCDMNGEVLLLGVAHNTKDIVIVHDVIHNVNKL